MFKREKKSPKNPLDFTLEIQELSASLTKNPKDSDKNFNRILSYLTHPFPPNRIAACEALGKTSRDVAVTNIRHWLQTEEDESVISAMKSALAQIKENARKLGDQ